MKNDSIIMKPADKGDGMVIWNPLREWSNHLDDKKIFKTPKKDSIKTVTKKHFDKNFLSIHILVLYSLVEFIYFAIFTKG